MAKLWSRMSFLLKHTSMGTLDLYKMLREYSMFEEKVFGFSQRTVSAMYRLIVGKVQARESVMICPEAD